MTPKYQEVKTMSDWQSNPMIEGTEIMIKQLVEMLGEPIAYSFVGLSIILTICTMVVGSRIEKSIRTEKNPVASIPEVPGGQE